MFNFRSTSDETQPGPWQWTYEQHNSLCGSCAFRFGVFASADFHPPNVSLKLRAWFYLPTYLPGNKMKQVRRLGHLAFKRKQGFVAKPAKKNAKNSHQKNYNRKLSDRCKGCARPWCHGENTRQCVTLGFAVVFLPFFASMLWPWPRSLYICLQT